MRFRTCAVLTTLALLSVATPANAEWRAANDAVTAAARTPRIAAVLAEITRLDAAIVAGDHAAFADVLAEDLAVNNPQNVITVRSETAARNAGGLIAYSRYDRTIEYAGLRKGMVFLMGEEHVVPREPSPHAGREVVRRFTDVWRRDRGRWRLTARQATIVAVR